MDGPEGGRMSPTSKMSHRPDIVLLSSQWQSRALLRAQLIEEGFEVVASDSWAMMREHLDAEALLAIVDLQELPEPSQVLTDLRAVMDPNHVLVLTAMNTVSPESIERLGFHVLERPISIGSVVAAVLTWSRP
jgi:DNA-binding response OmpR family regulator